MGATYMKNENSTESAGITFTTNMIIKEMNVIYICLGRDTCNCLRMDFMDSLHVKANLLPSFSHELLLEDVTCFHKVNKPCIKYQDVIDV